MTATDFLDLASPLAALVPVAGPALVAGLRLVRGLLGVGVTAEQIARINVGELAASLRDADARLDARAAAHDAPTDPPKDEVYPDDPPPANVTRSCQQCGGPVVVSSDVEVGFRCAACRTPRKP